MNNSLSAEIGSLWLRNGSILLAEFGLLVLSVLAAFAPFGGYNTTVSVSIASIMATLGLLFFMGLLRERALLRLAAAGGFFWLTILFTLTFADYLTRASASDHSEAAQPSPISVSRTATSRAV